MRHIRKDLMLFVLNYPSLSIFILYLIFSFAIFGNTISHPLLFDDEHLENYKGFYNLDNIPMIFSSPHHFMKSGIYRPMSMLTYIFNRLLFGDFPAGFRIVQILIYALNGWLLFLLLRKLWFDKAESVFISLLFLSHPIHNELVNVIIFRHELLAVSFGFMAILARLSSKNLFLAYSLFFASFLSKESGVVILMILWYILLFNNTEKTWLKLSWPQKTKSLKNDLIFSAVLVLCYSLIRFKVLGKLLLYNPTTIVESPLQYIPFSESALTALKVIGIYAKKLIYPATLSIDYSYNQISIIKTLFNSWALLGLGLILLSITLLMHIRINYKIRMAAIFFLFPLILVSNIFFKVGAIMAERWLYIPSISMAILTVMGINALFKKKLSRIPATGSILLIVIIILFSFKNWHRNLDWEDNLSLYKSTVKISPNSVLARNNLAAAYLLKNDLDSAEKELNIATGIYPYYSHLLNNWGIFYLRKGNLIKAKEYFYKTLERYPEYFRAHENLAIIFEKEGNYDDALKYASMAYELSQISQYVDHVNYLREKLKLSGTQK